MFNASHAVRTGLAVLLLMAATAPVQAGWLGRSHRGDDRIEGSGVVEELELDLDGFEAIAILGLADVEVTIGPDFEVVMAVEDNLIDLIDVRVSGRELRIDLDDDVQIDTEDKSTRTHEGPATKPEVVVTKGMLILVFVFGQRGGEIVEFDFFGGPFFLFFVVAAEDLTLSLLGNRVLPRAVVPERFLSALLLSLGRTDAARCRSVRVEFARAGRLDRPDESGVGLGHQRRTARKNGCLGRLCWELA